MIYQELNLIFKEDTGERDRLGNIVYSKRYSREYKGRFTEWNADDVDLYGRSMTEGNRKVLVRGLSEKDAKEVDSVLVDGKEYDIISKKDLMRWHLLIIKGFRL